MKPLGQVSGQTQITFLKMAKSPKIWVFVGLITHHFGFSSKLCYFSKVQSIGNLWWKFIRSDRDFGSGRKGCFLTSVTIKFHVRWSQRCTQNEVLGQIIYKLIVATRSGELIWKKLHIVKIGYMEIYYTQ